MQNPINILIQPYIHLQQQFIIKPFGLLVLAAALVLSSQFSQAEAYPVGTLKTNQYLVHLINDRQSRKYEVFDHNGNLILQASSDQELIAKLPELKSLINESTAYQDASLTTHRNFRELTE